MMTTYVLKDENNAYELIQDLVAGQWVAGIWQIGKRVVVTLEQPTRPPKWNENYTAKLLLQELEEALRVSQEYHIPRVTEAVDQPTRRLRTLIEGGYDL